MLTSHNVMRALGSSAPPPAGAAAACRVPPAACHLPPAAARQPAYRIYRGSAATTDPITGTVRPYRTADVLATMLATPWLGQWLLAAARAPFVVTTCRRASAAGASIARGVPAAARPPRRACRVPRQALVDHGHLQPSRCTDQSATLSTRPVAWSCQSQKKKFFYYLFIFAAKTAFFVRFTVSISKKYRK